MIIKLFLQFLIFANLAFSQNIIFDASHSKISILENSQLYIDETSKLNFKKVQKKKFITMKSNYLRLGYTNVTAWVKFSIKNNSNKKLVRYITITNPMLDTIELFIKQKDGTFKKKTQGVLHLNLYQRNNILHPNFKVQFNPNETKEFYYKTFSLSCANYYKLFFKDHNQLYKDEFQYQLIEALFFGAMSALILYNLFIFLFIKDKSYFYYVLFLFFIMINHSSYSVMLDYIISSPTLTKLEAYLAVYYLGIATILGLLFIQNILDINRFKILKYITYTLIFINIILMLLSTNNNYLIESATNLIFVVMIYIYFLSIYSLIKKHPLSKYIFAAWTINVIGIINLAFKQYGILNIIDYIPYFYELCTFLEAIIFSTALASKISKTKELENSLKTNEILTKELHHRVKNNMQFIIIMYRLKLANHINKDVDEKLKEIENSIQAISNTHEILYNQSNLKEMDTKKYFINLINEIKKSFDMKNIDIEFNIDTYLETQQAMYCGIILNELVTNSIKYAFKNSKGNITISLHKKNKEYIFMIEDNGCGFNYKEKSELSFGLSFINAIVEYELKGKSKFINKNGTKVKIVF